MSITVISLNVWRGALMEPLLAFLRESDADVFCLQEVLDYPEPAVLKTESSSGLMVDVHLDTLSKLKAALPGYQCFFHPSCFGWTYDEETLAQRLLYGNATFVRSGLAVIESSVAMVHDSYRLLAPGEYPTPRNAICLRIFNDGVSYVVAQMHGLWIEEGKHDTLYRRQQAAKLAGTIRQVGGRGPDFRKQKIIACGDFNLLPGSQTFSILGELGLRDLVVGNGFTDTRTSLYRKEPRFADYMLVSDRAIVDEFDVLAEPVVSDHRALRLVCR